MNPQHTLMRTADLQIRGLDNEPATRGVRSALNCIHGVSLVSVAPGEQRVSVTYDAFRVLPCQFETAVSVMGCEIEGLLIRSDLTSAIDPAADGQSCAETPRPAAFARA